MRLRAFFLVSLFFSQTLVSADAATDRGELKSSAKLAKETQAAEAAEEAVKAQAPRLERVTRVVGDLKGHVLTSREVILSGLLDELFQEEKTLSEADFGGSNFVVAVNRTLDEWVVYSEAKELNLVQVGSSKPKSSGKDKEPSAEEARSSQLVEAAFKKMGSREVWKKIEPSPAEVRQAVSRKTSVRQFERLKAEAAQAAVTDTDALQYYRKNRLRFGGLPFENFKENIKKMLSRQQTEKRLTEWRMVLRRKYRARNSIGTGV